MSTKAERSSWTSLEYAAAITAATERGSLPLAERLLAEMLARFATPHPGALVEVRFNGTAPKRQQVISCRGGKALLNSGQNVRLEDLEVLAS